MPNTNTPVVAGATNALEQMKYEIASEIGIPNYASIDKGNLPARANGKIGGNMTKRLIQYAEQQMINH